MAALMRSARFFSPAVQIPKLLRVVSSGTPHPSIGLSLKKRSTVDQRSWRSTVVEGVETETNTKLETMVSTVERYVRRFGRISRKQLDPIVSCLDKEGSISVSNSLSLLRLYGSSLFDEPPANRLKLADELWEKFKKHGITLEVMHYNTLLAVYNMNKLRFSPTEFLASMEANGVTPNRITYQRLITRFCEAGDIEGATQVLEHMKSASLPINDHVFNSFITGHLRSNDPDNARNIVEVMRQTGLEPTSATYTVLAMGFAERGEIEEVKKYINQAEMENVHLRPGQLLDVYVALAVSGHSQHLAEVVSFLHSGTPFNQDAIRVCNQLIAAGYDDAAYQLFLEMPKPSRLDVDQTTLGRFFLRALAKHERPVEKVVTMVKDMQERDFNRDDLSAVAQLAYLEGKPAYALTVLEKMKEEGLPVRAHYFWPALCQFRDAKNKEGIYEVMRKMSVLCNTRDDFIQTLHGYTIPALLAADETDFIGNLEKCGFDVKDIHFSFFLFLLEQLKLQEALEFLEKHEVSVYMASVRACLLSLVGRDKDWHPMLQILTKLKEQSGVWRAPALECTALVLKQILMKQKKADWADTQDVFNIMLDNDLKILKRSQVDLLEYFDGAPSEVQQGLKDVVSTDRATNTAEKEPSEFAVPADLSLKELKNLAEQKPNNKAVLKRLLIKACAVGDAEEAERVRSVLEGEGFVFPPIMLAQLAYLYATFVKDLAKASAYLQQLEETFPEHENYQTVVLKMAALHAEAGDTDAAVDRLKSFAEKHAAVVERQDVKREENFSDILRSAADVDTAKRLMAALTDCGYLPSDSPFLLDTYMEKVLNSGDAEHILQEFEEIVKTHKRSPQVDKVLQFFINKEDPDSLQKAVDLLTSVHGLMNVLHHLIADFIECGHVKKARKIMETAGLRANMQRLNYYCQSFIERNMIKELEMLVEVTKDMFAVDRDNMLFHLIRGYVKQKEMDKAKDVLLKYEEEMIQPSARTLRFLARSLERAGLPVPFEVPDFQPPVNTQREARAKTLEVKGESVATEVRVTTLATALQVKDSLEKGDVDQVLTMLKSDKTLLAQAMSVMRKPWPSAALQSLFESLVQQGEVDILMAINEYILPFHLKNSLRAHIFTAAVNSGRGEEVIERMEGVTSNTAKFMTFPALDTLSDNAPHLMDKLESLCRRLESEKKYTEPLSVLWCYYKYRDSPRADVIMKETPGFNKTVLTGALCQTAVKENKVDVLESLLKLKKDAGEKQGMAVVYSNLLHLCVEQNNVEAVEKTCEKIVEEGLLRSNLRRTPVIRVENLLKENNKPLPAWGDDSSSDSSSSTSDEEVR